MNSNEKCALVLYLVALVSFTSVTYDTLYDKDIKMMLPWLDALVFEEAYKSYCRDVFEFKPNATTTNATITQYSKALTNCLAWQYSRNMLLLFLFFFLFSLPTAIVALCLK